MFFCYFHIMKMEDLLQEGYIGLSEAVSRYDADKNSSFIHYAAFWIRQSMSRYADNCSSVVRIPVHAREYVVAKDGFSFEVTLGNTKKVTYQLKKRVSCLQINVNNLVVV